VGNDLRKRVVVGYLVLQLSPRAASALSPGGSYTVDIRMQLSLSDTKLSGSNNDVLATLGGSKPAAPSMLEVNPQSLGSSLQNQNHLGLLHATGDALAASPLDASPTANHHANFPTFVEMETTTTTTTTTALDMQQQASYSMQYGSRENLAHLGCRDSTTSATAGLNVYDNVMSTRRGWKGRRTREWNADFQERSHVPEEWGSPRSPDGTKDDSSLIHQDQWDGKSIHLAYQNLLPDTASKRAKVSKRHRQEDSVLVTSPPTSPSQDESGTNSSTMWESLLHRSNIMHRKHGGLSTGKRTEASTSAAEGREAPYVPMDLDDDNMDTELACAEEADDSSLSIIPSDDTMKRFQGRQRNLGIHPSCIAGGMNFEPPNNLLADTMNVLAESHQRELPNQLCSSSGYNGTFMEAGWQEMGAASDYNLLLTSAVAKAHLLDLQIQENQRHLKEDIISCSPDNDYMGRSKPTDNEYERSMVSGLRTGFLQEDGSFCHSNLSMLQGQEYASNDFFLDSRCEEQLTARAAYEKARNDQHDDLPSKRVFKRSSKGGPRRPHIIKGQWTPEEDRHVPYSCNFCIS
jgi:hypothetical protein